MIQGAPELHWARLRLFGKFRGQWASLAQSKFGCWGLEKLFNVVDVQKKARSGSPFLPRLCHSV